MDLYKWQCIKVKGRRTFSDRHHFFCQTVAICGRAGQGRAGQGRAGQGRAGQGRAGQGRAGQGRAGHLWTIF